MSVKYYDPRGGENIGDAVKNSIKAAQGGHDVVMTFNEVTLNINETSNPEETVKLYHQKCVQMQRAYDESPQGQAAAFKRAAESAGRQQSIDALVDGLDDTIKDGIKKLVPWAAQYANDSNDLHVNCKADVVLSKLAAGGYKDNDCIGKDFDGKNKNNVGRYIIGQVMAGLLKDGSPPMADVVAGWAEKFEALPDAEKIRPKLIVTSQK